MFGLMRAKKCGMSAEEKDFRRLNYCGTCKTIGSLYGQKTRLLLNHDTVFLAEILTALSEDNVQNWQKSYQSYNCLNLPRGEMPVSIQFAATANVILTEFKLVDHFADEGKKRYELARKTFAAEMRQAENLLNEWRFPLDEVKTILQSQAWRENLIEGKSVAEIFESVAAPTAETTAIFFAEGVKLINKIEAVETGRKLGFAFGKLIYLLDAFEDYQRDFQKNQFNAFRAAFELKESNLSAPALRKINSILRELEREIIEKIYELPVSDKQKSTFTARLSENLNRKLKTNLPVMPQKKQCVAKQSLTFTQRWQSARLKAGNLARGYSWQLPLVFTFVFVLALIAPAQSRDAKSARECFDLSFNLMFLGAMVGAVFSAPILAMQNLAPEKVAEKIEKKRRENWCDSCDCCDCCSDGCNCDCCCVCDNCCDGCDCCSCDC